jgi:hypothetical protein
MKLLQDNGNELKRDQIINWLRIETGKSRDSLSWSLKNMAAKGILRYDPYTDCYSIPDYWREALKSERGIDRLPQELFPISKRMELMRLAFEHGLIENELEGYGLYGLLDLNLESLQKVVLAFEDENARKAREEKQKEDETSSVLCTFHEMAKENI